MSVQQWSTSVLVAQLGVEPGLTEDIDDLTGRAQGSEPSSDVVVDMANVEYLNSSHLSALLRLRKLLIDKAARLRLASPTDEAWALFLATGLDKVFDFAQDTSTALAQLQLKR